MKLFFVLGRNPELSRLELLSYFGARGIVVSEFLFEDNLLVLESLDFGKVDIQVFGGVIRLGKIDFEGSQEDFDNYLEREDVVPSDKFSYAVFGNMDPEVVKVKFKCERRKAVLKHGRRLIKMQDGSSVSLPKADYSLFLQNIGNKIFFGLVSQSYDSEDVERRDMQKPVRRPSLAISPRLAKILINLSGAVEGDFLLDPFCGIGGILQEALLKKIDVFGSDKDKGAIHDAQRNLKWLSNNFGVKNSWSVEVRDAKSSPNKGFVSVATETPLGVLVKKRPTDVQSKKMIHNFESFIIPVLRNLGKAKNSGVRIAITFPAIRKFRVNVQRVANSCGLKVVAGPVLESRSDQFIGRDIIVLE